MTRLLANGRGENKMIDATALTQLEAELEPREMSTRRMPTNTLCSVSPSMLRELIKAARECDGWRDRCAQEYAIFQQLGHKDALEINYLRALLAKAAGALRELEKEPWRRCPSTHCERSQECRTPHECSGAGRALARRTLFSIQSTLGEKALTL